jgi:hypothetical protein
MTDTNRTDRIIGNISANPNPVPFGQGCVLIPWKTNDCAGGEVCVSTSSGGERFVSRGNESGEVQIPWITDSITYDFRLYGASQPEIPIDSVKSDATSTLRR